ncbi:MAG: CPBP family intramembrane glutamic endopeptidase, partial [Myxococcota bacterium]
AVLPIAAATSDQIETGELSWLAIFAIDAGAATVLAAIAIAVGVWLGPATDLGTLFGGEHRADWLQRTLPLTLFLGITFGVLTALCLEGLISTSLLPRDLFSEFQKTAWKGVLVSVSAGIKEELLLRFGLMPLWAWSLMKLSRSAQAGPGILWTANIIAALLFGLVHLPAASTVLDVTPFVIAVVLTLNGIAGVTFGWLYWRRGIAAAIMAHFFADIVLQVLYPLAVGASTL